MKVTTAPGPSFSADGGPEPGPSATRSSSAWSLAAARLSTAAPDACACSSDIPMPPIAATAAPEATSPHAAHPRHAAPETAPAAEAALERHVLRGPRM